MSGPKAAYPKNAKLLHDFPEMKMKKNGQSCHSLWEKLE